MLTPHNTYRSVTLAPLGSLVLVIETLVTNLPIQNATVIVRNIDDTNPLTVDWKTTLTVANAGVQFNGTWINPILNTSLAAEQMLVLTPTIKCLDGQWMTHTLTLTNPSAVATLYAHVLVNGSIDAALSTRPTTQVLIP